MKISAYLLENFLVPLDRCLHERDDRDDDHRDRR